MNFDNDIMIYGFPPRYGFDFLNYKYKKPKFYLSMGGKEEQDTIKKGNDNEQSRES